LPDCRSSNKSLSTYFGLPVLACGTILVVAACGGDGQSVSGPNNDQGPEYCGTPTPSANEIASVESLLATVPATRAAGDVTIPVYVHVITMDDGSLDVADATITEQIRIMNEAFAGLQAPGGYKTKFKFQFVSTDRTANSAWCTSARDSADEVAMKTALRRGSADDLNLYIRDLPPGLGGYGGFPWWYPGAPHMDGPTIDYTGVVGYSSSALGDLAVHEVGHWLGLYHTFQGGCEKNNDYVSDTPAQAGPTWGCPAGNVDTCTGNRFPGYDPTMNFMDYTANACQYQFTKAQSSRMDSMWATYRAGK